MAAESQPNQHFSFSAPTGASAQTGFNATVSEPTPAQTRERVRLLAKLRRRNAKKSLEQQVLIDDNASLESLRTQSAGASYEAQAKMAVLMMRRITTFIAKIVEGVCKRYPEYTVDLDGWAENVYLSLDNYDDMLYDIYDAYGDNFKGNPIVVYIFALGSNAAMYAITKKIIDNPVSSHVLSGLASAFNKNVEAAAAMSVPPPTEKPAVPVAVADSGNGANPTPDLAGMFAGADINEMLGGLDLNGLMSSMGDILGGANSRRTGNVSAKSSAPRVVNAMSGVPADQDQDVMSLLRKQQDLVQTNAAGPEVEVMPTISELSSKEDLNIRVVDDMALEPAPRRNQPARLSLDDDTK